MYVFTDHALMKDLNQPGEKIVMLVMDGLGGLPMEIGGKTELESAHTPNLDKLAAEGSTGLSVPIRPGVEPGSGPAHISLFSYDPVAYPIGRGVLEALGINFPLTRNDIAARGNFATVDPFGLITDRRAGRISTDECIRICAKLQAATGNLFPGFEVFVEPVKEHRFVLVLRGQGLGGELTETDPLVTGQAPLPVTDTSNSPQGALTAQMLNTWVETARATLADEPQANSVNLRGIARDPGLPPFTEIYSMRSACIAVYPMYKGVARLVGMDIIDFEGMEPADEIGALERVWEEYDFFFIHVKKTDSYGEDGNFEAKAHVIETVDEVIPRILALQPGALIITGDHSTPALLRSHSSHPVPTILWSPRAMPDQVESFGEHVCAHGHLGIFHATNLIPQAMGHAGRLSRYGA